MSNESIILEAADMDRILTRMSHEILEMHRGVQKLVLIGIRTRGVYLAERIQNKVEKVESASIPRGNIDINLYRDDWTSIRHQPIVQATDIQFSIDGKEVVLVDDVLFTGRTVRAAMDALIDFGRPDRIELAVLVDRDHRELPIQADYVGKSVETRRSERVNVYVTEHDGRDLVVLE